MRRSKMMPMGKMCLSEALALLDQIDTGQVVREFYILRGPASSGWEVHNRQDGKWTVTRATRLSDAICAQFEAPETEDWRDLV